MDCPCTQSPRPFRVWVLPPTTNGETISPVVRLGVGAWELNMFLSSLEPWEICYKELGRWLTFYLLVLYVRDWTSWWFGKLSVHDSSVYTTQWC